MNVQTFLTEASRSGLRLSVHGEKLDVDAPKDALTPDVMEFMKQHKPEIVEALKDHLPHGSCFQCGVDTRCMLTRPNLTWDWQCISCFDRSATTLPTSEKAVSGDSVRPHHG